MPDETSKIADWKVLAALLATTAVFLAIAAYPRQWSLGLLINDEFWYAQLAHNLYAGKGYVSNVLFPLQAHAVNGFPVPEPMKQPGFQLVTALVWLFTGESVHAMLLVALFGLVAFAGAIYLLARHLGWSQGVSLFVVGATLLHPVIAQYGLQALPESLYFACFTLTLLLILRGGLKDVAAAGALNAALILIKGHGLFYVPVFAAFLWVRRSGTLRRALRPSPAKLRAAGLYVVVIVLTLALAALLLPAGSVQLFQASGTYSYGLLIEVGRATSEVPSLSVDPPAVWPYIVAHPGQYLGKVARMVRRTKIMVDVLAGPAMGGVLFPALLLSCLLLVFDAVRPGKLLPAARDRGEAEPYLLFAALIGWALLMFWPIFLSARFIAHTLPLMLLICLYAGARLRPLLGQVPRALGRSLAAAALIYFVAYPGAATLWESYRTPLRLLGSMLAVRHLDYARMAENVRTYLPPDAVIVSDMAQEIAWLTGRDGIAFPNSEQDLEYLVDKYNVDAVYEHPLFHHDWPFLSAEFTLVDDQNGLLWVRRRAPGGAGSP